MGQRRARRLDTHLGVNDFPIAIRCDALHPFSHGLSIRFGPETPGILACPRYVYLLSAQSDFDEPVGLHAGALVCPGNKIQNEKPSRRFCSLRRLVNPNGRIKGRGGTGILALSAQNKNPSIVVHEGSRVTRKVALCEADSGHAQSRSIRVLAGAPALRSRSHWSAAMTG